MHNGAETARRNAQDRIPGCERRDPCQRQMHTALDVVAVRLAPPNAHGHYSGAFKITPSLLPGRKWEHSVLPKHIRGGARPETELTFADRRDDACAICTWRPRIARVHAQHVEHVPKVQPDGADRYLSTAEASKGVDGCFISPPIMQQLRCLCP